MREGTLLPSLREGRALREGSSLREGFHQAVATTDSATSSASVLPLPGPRPRGETTVSVASRLDRVVVEIETDLQPPEIYLEEHRDHKTVRFRLWSGTRYISTFFWARRRRQDA